MKVVVTGTTGYIGGHIVELLLANGHEVAAVVRKYSMELPASVKQFVDAGDDDVLLQEFTDFDAEIVIHCAAAQVLKYSIENSAELVDTNIGFGARMLAISHDAGVRGFIAAGTFATHADGTPDYQPQNLYAATKQAFSSIAAHYQRNSSMKVVTLELSDTYGPHDPRPKFLNLVREAARSGKTLEASPGLQTIHPIHVDDVAQAFMHCAQLILQDAHLDYVYSVHGPAGVTLQELVKLYEAATDCKVSVAWGALEYRPFEIMQPYTGETLHDWSAKISLSEGLKNL
uniref:NAD-dependent epimerase/dehydratase family protein n=1 Tax=uncultured Actinomycetes bacterium TaxID=152507 RepID=A0A871YC53_9ACTN|nr:NAD-dependent epimerase/dehydratase family protein [uncultured Actinomycetes bacterium]QOV09103.1 NAD-dependent epimerase/dehydratase family protein [uncultured Actinomycetes bacterium]